MEKVIIIGCPGSGKSTFGRNHNRITVCHCITWICCIGMMTEQLGLSDRVMLGRD